MKQIKLLLILVAVALISCKTEDKHKDLGDGMYAEIDTKYGSILLQLEYEKTPMTVANFVSLAEGTNDYVKVDSLKGKPFFNGLKFHRVMKDFMIQGGDPMGTGTGDPGYKFKDEFHKDLKHSGAGILSMANSGPATNGSQFFITHKATPWLDNKHSVFGHVLKGQEIVDVVVKDDIMEKITIIRKGDAAKAFNATKTFNEAFGEMEEEAKKAAAEQLAAMKSILDNEANAKEYESGLKITTLKKGTGAKPKKGQTVSIHYTGYLRNGKKIDSSVGTGKPFVTPIGIGKVVPGWDEGVIEMNVGTKAILYIPAHLAWGSRGAGGGVIPPNSAVIFEVELLDILK